MDQVAEPAWLKLSRRQRAAELARARGEQRSARPATPRARKTAPARSWAFGGRPQTEETRAAIGRAHFERWLSSVDLESVAALTRARASRRLSLRAAAEACGVDDTTFYRAERGLPITGENRQRIKNVFPEAYSDGE